VSGSHYGVIGEKHHSTSRPTPHSRDWRDLIYTGTGNFDNLEKTRKEEGILNRVEIVPVTNHKALRQFIRLPWEIYRDDPFWVPPLILDMKKLLDRSKHPFFSHSSADFFLARRDGQPVGRIAAILNNNHNRIHNERTAFFGFFESVNDRDVASALLDQAAQWAQDRGMTELRGPMNYSTNETLGLLIEGFDSLPCIMMSHNPSYYAELIESAQFKKVMDLYAWWLLTEKGLNPKITRVGEKVLKDEGIRVRTLNMKKFWEEVEIIERLYNDAWSTNWGFVPMTDAEFKHLAKDLKAVVDPRVVLIAEKNGEPVAFSLALPDFNQALKKINGRLFPLGLLKLLYHARQIRQVRVLALGIAKKVQNCNGLGAALYYESFRRGVEAGYRSCEFSWTLETNTLINRSMRLFGAQIYKRYRIYQKTL
jgi:GNAT superfamily N-acetyltransferase